MNKDKISRICKKATEYSIYGIAFYIPISTAFIEFFIAVAILSWFIRKAMSPVLARETFLRNPLFIPISFYILACLISSVLSVEKSISFMHLIFKTCKYTFLFFIVVEALDRKILRNAISVIIFSLALVVIDGLVQYFTHFDFLRLRNQVIVGRINGPFKMPNDFSNYIVTVLPLTASLCFINYKRKWVKKALLVISLLTFMALVFSATRSAWFAFVLTLPFILFLGNKKLAVLALLLIIIVLSLFPFLPEKTKYRVEHFFYLHEAGQYSHRILVWQMALNMLLERRFFGQGLGTFMYNFERFKPSYYPYNWETSYAHNCPLQIASETGLFGFFYFLSIIAVFLFFSFRAIKRVKLEPFNFYILSGLTLAVIAYLFSSLFDTNLYSVQLAVLFWFFLGLSTGTIRIVKKNG